MPKRGAFKPRPRPADWVRSRLAGHCQPKCAKSLATGGVLVRHLKRMNQQDPVEGQIIEGQFQLIHVSLILGLHGPVQDPLLCRHGGDSLGRFIPEGP